MKITEFKNFCVARNFYRSKFPMLSGTNVVNIVRKKMFNGDIKLQDTTEQEDEISKLWSDYEKRINVSKSVNDKHELIGLMNSVKHGHKEFKELDYKLHSLLL